MLEVRLLGQFDVQLGGSRVNIPTRPARFLYAYLLLNKEIPQSREKLAALFWPDSKDTNALSSVRQAKWRINKAIASQQSGAEIVTGDDFFLVINPDVNLWLDTAVLSQESGSAAALIEAVSVYGGELLPDCYDDWAVVEREFYRGLFDQKMQLLLDLLTREQSWSEVIYWAERWITLGQSPEPAYCSLMVAHAALGDVSQVEKVFRRCKEALWRDLGVEPSEQTKVLRDRLVKGELSETRGYVLQELISSSESGEVYRAFQPLLNREVALKVITPRLANSPDFIRRFESEAQLIARLQHLHIRPLYDYWRYPGGAFLVMRWLEGGNLGERLRQGALPVENVVRLLDQTAAALAAAHYRGIIHGHLKPDNVLFDGEYNAYLSDFGIALDVNGNSGDRAGASGLRYRAPEQNSGEPPTDLSDQFSLALILYEALAGQAALLDRNGSSYMPRGLPELPHRIREVFERAFAEIPSERFPDVLALADALRQALAPELPQTAADGLEPVSMLEIVNPYKGLRAFQEADAGDFYGREELVSRILDRLSEQVATARFLALIGPSGSGKTSVIQAGLLPALRRGGLPGSEGWYVVEMSPGAAPLAELAVDLLHIASEKPAELSALLRQDEFGLLRAARQVLPDPDSELLLIIDHLEELFTLVEDQGEVDHFLNLIAAAVMDPQRCVRVIVSMRADFYDRPLMHRELGELLRQRTEVVIPMNADAFWRAAVTPAERAGLALEPGLATTIVSEVMERPSALPLFQYALTELFEQREGRLLTRSAYEAIGGVAGALARRAEAVYERLTSQERTAAKQVLLRLVEPEDGGSEALRRVPLSEFATLTASKVLVEADDLDFTSGWNLDSSGVPTDNPIEHQEIEIGGAAVRSVLQAFGRSRLFTFDHDPATREPTVEVAHDALLREWSRLRGWLDDSRSDLRSQRRLANAAKDWLAAERDPSYLMRGKRLDQLQSWAEATTLVLNLDEQEFLETSLAVRRRQLDEASARQLHDLQLETRSRRRDRIAAVVGVLTLLLGLTAVLLFGTARQQANAALSRQLAADCLSSKNDQFDLALLLCLEAEQYAETFEARDALSTLFAENPYLSHFLRGHQSAVTDLVFSQDGGLLASGGADGSTLFWDAALGRPLEPGQNGDTAGPGSGKILAAVGADSRVNLWEVGSDDPPYELPAIADGVTSLAVNADDQTLAIGTANGRILFWDIPSRRLTGNELQGHSGPVDVLTFSADGTALASGGLDNTVLIWDLASGTARTLLDHTGSVLALAFSSDGRFVASSSALGSLTLSDLANDPISNKLLENGHRADALAFSPDGSQLAAGFMDGTISLWDVTAGLPFVEGIIGHDGAIRAIAYSPGGELLASGGDDREIILRSMATNESAHTGAVNGVRFQPGGHGLVTSSVDGTVQFWNPGLQSSSTLSHTGQSEGVIDVAFSPDGRLVASAGRDGTIVLLDAAKGQELRILIGHGALVTSVAFSPDGTKLASGGADDMVFLWDIVSRERIGRALEGHEDWVFSVAFSPDGKLLASGSRDNKIILWDVETGQAVGEPLEGHNDWVYSLAFSPDGRWLASGGADNLIYLWDLSEKPASGQPIAGHDGYVFDVSFSPDSKLLFSGGDDGFIRSWDVQTGEAVGEPLKAHQGAVYSLDVSDDGEWMASGGQDAAVRLWRSKQTSWACEGVGRNLTRGEWAAALQGQSSPISRLLGLSYERTCPQWPIES